jgi:hypothetical protein
MSNNTITISDVVKTIGTHHSFFGINALDAPKQVPCPDGFRIVTGVLNSSILALEEMGYAAKVGSVKVRTGDCPYNLYVVDIEQSSEFHNQFRSVDMIGGGTAFIKRREDRYVVVSAGQRFRVRDTETNTFLAGRWCKSSAELVAINKNNEWLRSVAYRVLQPGSRVEA